MGPCRLIRALRASLVSGVDGRWRWELGSDWLGWEIRGEIRIPIPYRRFSFSPGPVVLEKLVLAIATLLGFLVILM